MLLSFIYLVFLSLLKLLVGIRAGKTRATMQKSLDELLARQRADGGWSQNAEMASDAFATGQALYVLALRVTG